MCSPESFSASSQPGTVCATDLWDGRMCPQHPARGARRGFAAGQAPRDLPDSDFSLWLRSAGGSSRDGRSLVTRAVPVPDCGVVMDMEKDMARKEVLHAGRAPAATAGDAACDIEEVQGRMEQRWQLLGLNLQFIPCLNSFSPRSLCVISFSPCDLFW